MEILEDEKIMVGELEFRKYISEEQIKERISKMALEIDVQLKGKDPIFIAVLNGSFIFCSDLVRATKKDYEIEFLKVKSYEGMESAGVIKETLNTLPNIEGRDVFLVEDIVDKGHTINYLHDTLSKDKPSSISIVSLLFKPSAYQHKIKIDHVGFEIPNDFVVGYGLDYNGLGRSLKDIYVLND